MSDLGTIVSPNLTGIFKTTSLSDIPSNFIINSGQTIIVTSTGSFYIGDGVTTWANLSGLNSSFSFVASDLKQALTNLGSPVMPRVMSTPPTVSYSNLFGSTTISSPKTISLASVLSADTAIGSATLPARSKITIGKYKLGVGSNSEIVSVTAVTGSSFPYTATLTSPTVNFHASGDVLETVAVRFGGAIQSSLSLSGNAPSDFVYRTSATAGSGGSLQPSFGTMDFVTDSMKIEFNCLAGAGPTLVIDGELAQATPYGTPFGSGDRWWFYISFTTRKARRILVLTAPQCAQINIDTYATITVPPIPSGPRVGLMTDSYGQQQSNLIGTGGPFIDCMARLGWYDVYISPVGGTGYLNTNSTYTTFRQRIVADILNASPDIIYIAGGLNDQGRQTPSVFGTEALTLYQLIRSTLPKSWIVVDTVWTPDGTNISNANYTGIRDAALSSIQQVAGPWLFIDNITGGWLCSDGRSYTGSGPYQTGNGKSPTGPGFVGVRSTAASGGTFTAGTYYYVATAITASGESKASPEVSATVGANGTITVSAGGFGSVVTGVKLYRGTTAGNENLLVYSGAAGTIIDTGSSISSTTPPTTDTTGTAGSTPGNADYYIVDGTHPSRDGSDYLSITRAEVLARVLRTRL